MRDSRQWPGHALYIALQDRVVVNAVLLDDRLFGLAAKLQFILLAEQHQLALPGDRVHGAPAEKAEQR